jgi:hypothetical protein
MVMVYWLVIGIAAGLGGWLMFVASGNGVKDIDKISTKLAIAELFSAYICRNFKRLRLF